MQDLLTSLDSDFEQLSEVMRKIFDAFDKDHSGFIDINELNEVAKELGKPLDADELEECMKDLDINKDNKISYEEFSKWWLSGRQGLSPLMRRLLGFKLKSTQFFGHIQDVLSQTIEEAKNEEVQLNTNHFSLNINKVQNASTTVSAKLMLLSPEAKQEYTRMRVLHNFGYGEDQQPWILSVAFEIKNGAANFIQDQITAVLA